MVVETGEILIAQDPSRLTHLFQSFGFLDPDIEESNGRAVDAEKYAGRGGAHKREIDQVIGIRADRRADIEHDRLAAQRRPHRGDGGAIDQRHRAQADFRHRHQRAGIAGGNRKIRLALLDRLDRLPHRGDAPAGAQRLAWFVAHFDGDVGMKNLGLAGERRVLLEQRGERRLVAVKLKGDVGPAHQRDGRRRHDDRRAVIAAHGVHRDANIPGHLSSNSQRAPGPRRRRDNSQFVAQGNHRRSRLGGGGLRASADSTRAHRNKLAARCRDIAHHRQQD